MPWCVTLGLIGLTLLENDSGRAEASAVARLRSDNNTILLISIKLGKEKKRSGSKTGTGQRGF